jgi:hypothetical protein
MPCSDDETMMAIDHDDRASESIPTDTATTDPVSTDFANSLILTDAAAAEFLRKVRLYARASTHRPSLYKYRH